MIYDSVYCKQAIEFLEHKQSTRAKRPPHHIATIRKLETYIIDQYVESAASGSSRVDAAALRSEAIEKLRAVDFRRFHVHRFADGSVAMVEPISALFVERFLEHRLDLGDSHLTFNTMRNHLIHFFGWIGLEPNPAYAVMKASREPRKKIVPLSKSEVDSLLDAASKSISDLALCYVMLRCGPRASEVVSLRLDDYDRDRRILFLSGNIRKGGHAHHVPVAPDAALILEDYLDSTSGRDCHYLFPGKDGCQMTHNELTSILNRLADSAQIRRFSPHLLRHTAATLFATVGIENQGLDIAFISHILGHANPTITEQSYVHIPLDTLRKDLAASSMVRLVCEEVGFDATPDRDTAVAKV